MIKVCVVVCASIGISAMAFWAYMEEPGSSFAYILIAGVLVLLAKLITTVRAFFENISVAAAFLYVWFIFFYMIYMDRGPEDMLWLNLVPILSIFVFGISAGSIWAGLFLPFRFCSALDSSRPSSNRAR